jgi:hypothetical protein
LARTYRFGQVRKEAALTSKGGSLSNLPLTSLASATGERDLSSPSPPSGGPSSETKLEMLRHRPFPAKRGRR